MNVALFCYCLVVGVLAMRYYLPVSAARRITRAAAARQRMTQLALELERRLLRGELASGQVAHDFVARLVVLIECDQHRLTWREIFAPLWDRGHRARSVRLRATLERELSGTAIGPLLAEFFAAYYEEFAAVRPVQTRLVLLSLVILAGGATALAIFQAATQRGLALVSSGYADEPALALT